MRKKIVRLLNSNTLLRTFLFPFHMFIGRSRFFMGKRRQNNKLNISTAHLYHSTIIFNGCNNTVEIGDDVDFQFSSILVRGNNNYISIGRSSFINGLEVHIEGNDNKVLCGDRFFVYGNTRMWAIDGSSIIFDEDCMLSDQIDIRTSDNHSIIDRKSHRRINYEENIHIHRHVWIGTGVRILKGAELAEGCVVGAASVITRKHLTPFSVIAGNPGKPIRDNIDWRMDRVRDYK